ncbi:Putative GGDEF domain protein [Clostridium chauvoei JF4335]|nr:Putative GGDEF domain protein [Clostridium chauvoei JF4335]
MIISFIGVMILLIIIKDIPVTNGGNLNKTDKYIEFALNSDDENSIKVNNISEEFKNSRYIVDEIDKEIMKKKIEILKLKTRIVILMSIILLIAFYVLNNKNRKINELNNELQNISITDFLTGLYNKKFFYDKLALKAKNKELITLVIIDIDDFKLYNDNYGHIKGDEALKNIAMLTKRVFENDVVCRFGGEEFCIISNNPKEEVINKAKNLINKLYELNIEHDYSKISDRITISLGIENAIVESNEDAESLIKITDEKLYVSKKCGKDTYTY